MLCELNNHHVNMYDIMHMFAIVHVMSGGQAKEYVYQLSFNKTKSFSYDIFTVPDMSVGQALMWSIDMRVYLAS